MKVENINKDKVVGYLLLLSGLGLIAYALLNIYQLFTGQSEPYALFSFDAIALDFSKMAEGPVPSGTDLTQQLVSAEMINRPLNMAAYLLFMGFVSSIGYKIARVGTLLVRTIKVNVKQDKDGINITAK